MFTVTAMSATSVAAALVTLNRIVGWKFITKHRTAVDVTFTVGMGIAFAGTLTGMLVAVMAGLMMALFLSLVTAPGKMWDRMTDKLQREPIDSEHDADGNWVYNQAPYLREGELA